MFRLFGSRAPSPSVHDLDRVLLRWPDGSPWTVRDSLEGLHITGSNGSGKTRGSLSEALLLMLRAGYGAACFTAKPDDADLYRKLATDAGRECDVVEFSPTTAVRFNFIEAERSQLSEPLAVAEVLAGVVRTVCEAKGRGQSRGSGSMEAVYFQEAADDMCFRALVPLVLAQGELSIQALERFVHSAPQTVEEARDPRWQGSSPCFATLRTAGDVQMSDAVRTDLQQSVSYWLDVYPAMSQRTRSSIQSTLTVGTAALSRGLAREMVSATRPNLVLQELFNGKILIVDVPTLVLHDPARVIQVVLKTCLQRALARRDVRVQPTPFALVTDENHLTFTRADQVFKSVARSFRCAVVCATQSISNYIEALGSDAQAAVHSFLGNFSTQVFHQQTDTETIRYVQELIGRSRQLLVNGSSSGGGDWLAPLFGDPAGGSAGFSESFEFELQAGDLNGLARGGPPHWTTEAFVYCGGRSFRDGRTWCRRRIPIYRG